MGGITAIEIDGGPVRLHGNPLSPAVWRGKQWAVTTYGIEALDGTYAIEMGRLQEDLPDWSWIRHMGLKDWVDLADFTTAFIVALMLHEQSEGIYAEDLLNHYHAAVQERSPGA